MKSDKILQIGNLTEGLSEIILREEGYIIPMVSLHQFIAMGGNQEPLVFLEYD